MYLLTNYPQYKHCLLFFVEMDGDVLMQEKYRSHHT